MDANWFLTCRRNLLSAVVCGIKGPTTKQNKVSGADRQNLFMNDKIVVLF